MKIKEDERCISKFNKKKKIFRSQISVSYDLTRLVWFDLLNECLLVKLRW